MRVLYLSHTGLTEPLGRSQVLPYVLGLARRGWDFTILSFEKPESRDRLNRRGGARRSGRAPGRQRAGRVDRRTARTAAA